MRDLSFGLGFGDLGFSLGYQQFYRVFVINVLQGCYREEDKFFKLFLQGC